MGVGFAFTISPSDPRADFILSVFAVLGSAGKEALIPGGWDEESSSQRVTARIPLTGSCHYHLFTVGI